VLHLRLICNNYGDYANECAKEDRHKKGAEEGGVGLHVEDSDSYEDIDDIDDFAFLNLDLARIDPYEDSCGDNALFEEDRGYMCVNKVDVSDEHTFHQSKAHVNPDWIHLDNQSTTDIFCNKAILSNIREPGKSISIHCNAGTIRVSQVGMLKKYGEVWYNEFDIANILYMSKVKDTYPVNYDSISGTKFIVVQPTNEVVFDQSPA
jgi:hypothetical protein